MILIHVIENDVNVCKQISSQLLAFEVVWPITSHCSATGRLLLFLFFNDDNVGFFYTYFIMLRPILVRRELNLYLLVPPGWIPVVLKYLQIGRGIKPDCYRTGLMAATGLQMAKIAQKVLHVNARRL